MYPSSSSPKALAIHWSITQEQIRLFTLVTLATLFLFMMMNNALADDDPLGDVMCEVLFMIYGNLGRALATIAIVILGIGATLGKVSWGLCMTVAVGVSVIFNAHHVIKALHVLDGAHGSDKICGLND